MRARYLPFILIFFIWPKQSLGARDHCSHLSVAACAPGTFDDGTGKANGEAGLYEVKERLRKKIEPEIRKYFQDAYSKDPATGQFKNDYFRDTAIAGFGYDVALPECSESDDQVKIAKCNEYLVEASTSQMIFHTFEENDLGEFDRADGQMIFEGPGYEDMEHLISFIKDDVYDTLRKEIYKKTEKEVMDTSRLHHVKTQVFPKVQEQLIKAIELRFPEPTRGQMIKKIGAIKFNDLKCHEEGPQRGVDPLLTSNAYYYPFKNKINMCNGFFIHNTSDFNAAFAIAHELAHAIDPCNIARGNATYFKYPENITYNQAQESYPVPGLLSCLREENSVHARARELEYENNSRTEKAHPREKRAEGEGSTSDDDVEEGYAQSNPPGPPPDIVGAETNDTSVGLIGYGHDDSPDFESFCEDDQINESACDWWAIETTVQAIPHIHPNKKFTQENYRNGYANIFRGMCKPYMLQKEEMLFVGEGFLIHPDFRRRIDAIQAVHPEVRKQMGCTEPHPKYVYCDGQATQETVPDKKADEKIEGDYFDIQN